MSIAETVLIVDHDSRAIMIRQGVSLGRDGRVATPSRASCRARTDSASPTASRPDRPSRLGPLDPRWIGIGDASARAVRRDGWLRRANGSRPGCRSRPTPSRRPTARPSSGRSSVARSARSTGFVTPLRFWLAGRHRIRRGPPRRSRDREWPRIRADIDAGRLVRGRPRPAPRLNPIGADPEPPGPRLRLRGRRRRGHPADLRPELAGARRRHADRRTRRASASRPAKPLDALFRIA